jgi:hypothetical protein
MAKVFRLQPVLSARPTGCVKYSNSMGKWLLAVTIFAAMSGLALGQDTRPPDVSAGPVPPAIQQMPDRFQPPVPGCTDCYYTVPSGKVVGAMGTTNNEGIVVTHPVAGAAPSKDAAVAAPSSSSTSAAVAAHAYTDLVFKSGDGVWAIRSATPIPLFIGSATGLNRDARTAMALSSGCDLQSVDYSTQAGIITTLNIPLSLWDITTRTKLSDLPTDWNSWHMVKYPSVTINKRIPAGHRLQVKVVQPAFSALPLNFQFTINVTAHCLKGDKDAAFLPTGPKAVAPATKCGAGYKSVPSSSGATCVKQ